MKLIIWFLNVVQFLAIYLLVFALFFYGIVEFLPPEIGLTGEGVFPIIAIGIALSQWKLYNRLSNYIISKFK